MHPVRCRSTVKILLSFKPFHMVHDDKQKAFVSSGTYPLHIFEPHCNLRPNAMMQMPRGRAPAAAPAGGARQQGRAGRERSAPWAAGRGAFCWRRHIPRGRAPAAAPACGARQRGGARRGRGGAAEAAGRGWLGSGGVAAGAPGQGRAHCHASRR